MTENRKRKQKKPYSSLSYTTGDIELNISHFNKCMGTDSPSTTSTSESTEGNSLTESKRYVRRYYIRPQNIFCSNKAEIIKALIDLDDTNCSIYTLNNLGDEKDVSKLMNSDIIYYYDDGILYDKNKVKVMDYDLSIKKEENRKHFANVDKAPDKEFKTEYSDRMTDATELEEGFDNNKLPFTCDELKAALGRAGDSTIELGSGFSDDDACDYSWEIYRDGHEIVVMGWGYNIYTDVEGIENYESFDTVEDAYEYLEQLAFYDNAKLTIPSNFSEAFNLNFEDYNVYGEKLTEAKENLCCICGEPLEGYGNNPEPYVDAENGQCCDGCNLKFVMPARLDLWEDD